MPPPLAKSFQNELFGAATAVVCVRSENVWTHWTAMWMYYYCMWEGRKRERESNNKDKQAHPSIMFSFIWWSFIFPLTNVHIFLWCIETKCVYWFLVSICLGCMYDSSFVVLLNSHTHTHTHNMFMCSNACRNLIFLSICHTNKMYAKIFPKSKKKHEDYPVECMNAL